MQTSATGRRSLRDESGEDQKWGPTAPSQAMSVSPSRAKMVLYIRGDTGTGVPGFAFPTQRRSRAGQALVRDAVRAVGFGPEPLAAVLLVGPQSAFRPSDPRGPPQTQDR